MKQYIIEQKITAFVNRYEVYEAVNGQKVGLLAFVEQKRLAFKEEIIFYSDNAKTSEAFRVKAEKVMDIHGKFLVTNVDGERIGAMKKAFKSSLFRSTWEILANDDSIRFVAQEKSLGLALFRRLWALLPYIGDIPFLFKYHFNFIVLETGTVVASYVKTTRFRDHYLLQVEDDTALEAVGWQTFIAQCVLLDALQSR